MKRYMNPLMAFWDKVEKTDTCWIWKGSKIKNGYPYGMIKQNGKSRLAHRLSYEMAYGAIPPDMCILHTCDNPTCVNPSHLKLGSRADNMQDMYDKGRQPNLKGESHPRTALTLDQVKEIKRLHQQGISYGRLAKQFGIGKTTVYHIVKGESWK